MKRLNNLHLRHWSMALFIPVLMAGCSDEIQDFHPIGGNEDLKLELKAIIDQVSTTRADESGFADGDRIGVFVVNYTDGAPGELALTSNVADNVAVRLDANSGKWDSATDIYWPDTKSMVDAYGYYPFNNALSSVSNYQFEVAADQSISASNGDMGKYEASDFLWAKTTSSFGEKINLTFHHRLAGIKVILKEGDGFSGDEFAKLPKIVTVDNTVRTASINLATGEVTASGNADRNIVMNPEADCYRAVVVPQTVGTSKSTIGLAIDGGDYSYTSDKGITYTPGKLHTFTLTVNKKAESGTYTIALASQSITDWETDTSSHDFDANSYLMVETKEAGTLKDMLAQLGADHKTVKNLKVIGPLNDEDCILMRSEMDNLSSVNLKEATFPDNILPENAFRGNNTIRRFILPETIVEIGGEAMSGTKPTSAIVVPESVTKIGGGAFSYIWENGEIILPSKLEYLENGAFYHTAAKFEMRLPSTLKYIGEYAFEEANYAYGTFCIPQNLEFLGYGAFIRTGSNMTGDVVLPAGLVENLNLEIGFANGTNITLPEGIRVIDRLAGKFNSPVILPQSLEKIESGAFYCTRFSSPITFPENLTYIGPSAFLESNLPGKVEIPKLIDCVKSSSFNNTAISELVVGDQVLQIEEKAFGYNDNLRKVSLGRNIEFIGREAFSNCSQIQVLVCLAKEPPSAAGAFDGCDFDRTILEVPKGCVGIYRNAPGWKEFKNITEHHELAIDLSEITCLDKGVTRSAIIRAEGAWTITSDSDWITVDQHSGEGRDELTFTVSPQDPNAPSREGLIVARLDGKDYKVEVKVRQLKADEAEDTPLVLQEASPRQGYSISLIILGEGFTASQIVDGTYMNVMKQTQEQFFAIEPYKSHRNQFTVATALACSPEEGLSDFSTNKQTRFGFYDLVANTDLTRKYVEDVFGDLVKGHMENVMVIFVANHNVFAGWSTICDDKFTIASVGRVDDDSVYPYDQRGLVQHFAGGEAFAGLGDEAVSHFDHIKSCRCGGCNALNKFNEMKRRGYFANLSLSGKMNEVPWKDFIFSPNYSADVDMWEGGYRHLRGVWRSESQSVMGTYISYYNVISRYAIYNEIMRRAGLTPSLEDFIQNDIIEKP